MSPQQQAITCLRCACDSSAVLEISFGAGPASCRSLYHVNHTLTHDNYLYISQRCLCRTYSARPVKTGQRLQLGDSAVWKQKPQCVRRTAGRQGWRPLAPLERERSMAAEQRSDAASPAGTKYMGFAQHALDGSPPLGIARSRALTASGTGNGGQDAPFAETDEQHRPGALSGQAGALPRSGGQLSRQLRGCHWFACQLAGYATPTSGCAWPHVPHSLQTMMTCAAGWPSCMPSCAIATQSSNSRRQPEQQV